MNLETLEFWMVHLNEMGIWDILTFILASAGIVGFFRIYRSKVHQFSLYPTYQFGVNHGWHRNVMFFEARNLKHFPIVLCRPNFKFSKILNAGDSAHGNVASGDYELKFRRLDEKGKIIEGNSYTTIMLRHRESAVAYLPIDSSLDEEKFRHLRMKRIIRRPYGWIYFDIVEIADIKPKVTKVKQSIATVRKEMRSFPLGHDPTKRAGGESGRNST